MAMKLITAIIRPYKLDDLEMAVAQLGVQGMTVVEVQGYGAEHGHSEVYRGAQYRIDFVPRTQVQIAVDETIVEPVIEAIANEEMGEPAAAQKVYPLLASTDPAGGTVEMARSEALSGILKVQKVRQEHGLKPIC